MKRFKLVNLVLLVILLSLIVASPVLAATYKYSLAFSVKDTGGTGRTYVPVVTGIGYSSLAAAGYATTATGTVVFAGTTQYSAMVGTTQTVVLVPSLPASNTQSLNLLTDYSVPWATQPIMVGATGYVTVTDDAALEPAAGAFSIVAPGYLDTTYITNASLRTLLRKDAAIRAFVPQAGHFTSEMIGYTARETQGAGVSTVDIYGSVWGGQTFTAGATYHMAFVGLTGYRAVGSTGNLNVSIYATAAGLPTGAALATYSYDIPTGLAVAPGGAFGVYPYINLTNGVVYSIVVSAPSCGVATPVTLMYNNADPYAGGTRVHSADGGTTWAADAGDDLVFQNQSTIGATVTGLSSGATTVTISSDGATWTTQVGATSQTQATGGAAVPANANDWILFENSVMPYVTSFKQTIAGTLISWYEPNAVIAGTVLPDREGAVQNGAITFGANSNITVTIGGFTSYASVAGSSPATGTADTFQNADMPAGWFSTGTGATLPFYDSFNTAATGLGISTQTLYIMMMMAVALAVGLMAGIMTGSWLIGTIGIGVMILAGVNTGVMPVWILFVYAVMGGGVLYLSKQV